MHRLKQIRRPYNALLLVLFTGFLLPVSHFPLFNGAALGASRRMKARLTVREMDGATVTPAMRT